MVNVASEAMAKTFDLQALRDAPRFLPVRAYGPAKLALVMSGYALARRLEGTGVTVNAVHPGLTATGIWQAFTPRPLRPFLRATLAAAVKAGIFLTPEQGSATTIYAATAPELAAVTGTYFVQEREHRSPPDSYDTVLQERLWELSGRLVGLAPDVPRRRALERDVSGDAAQFAAIRTSAPLPTAAAPPARFAAILTTHEERSPSMAQQTVNLMTPALAPTNPRSWSQRIEQRLFRPLIMPLQIALYRWSGGRVGSQISGVRFLLLTATGRKSGKTYTTPLAYIEHEEGYVVAATNAGFPHHPGWYHNLKIGTRRDNPGRQPGHGRRRRGGNG